MDIKYYTFKIKKGTPVKGQVLIDIGPNNMLIGKELKRILEGGGAQYIYDIDKDKIVDKAYFK